MVWNLFFVYREGLCSPVCCLKIQEHNRRWKPGCQWRLTLNTLLTFTSVEASPPFSVIRVGSLLCTSLLSSVAVEIRSCYFSQSLPGSISCVPWLSWSHHYISKQQLCTLPRPDVTTFTACAFLSLCLIRKPPFSQAGLPPLLDFMHWEMESAFASLKRHHLLRIASQECLSNNSLNRKRLTLLKFRVLSFLFDSPVFLETANSTRAFSVQSSLPPILMNLPALLSSRSSNACTAFRKRSWDIFWFQQISC